MVVCFVDSVLVGHCGARRLFTGCAYGGYPIEGRPEGKGERGLRQATQVLSGERGAHTEPELASAPPTAPARAASLVTRLITMLTTGVYGLETACVSTRSQLVDERAPSPSVARRCGRVWKWIRRSTCQRHGERGNRATAIRGASNLRWYPSKRVTKYQGKRGRARAEMPNRTRF